jgi:hypothetical protein
LGLSCKTLEFFQILYFEANLAGAALPPSFHEPGVALARCKGTGDGCMGALNRYFA